MEIKNIISSTGYLEFINELDSLIWQLLYSQSEGYTLLTAKDAVLEASSVIEKYKIESEKIAKKVNFKNTNEILEDKKQELIAQVNKHYKKEVLNWANNVYEDMIDNCLLCASINKDNKENIDKLYHRALCAISWIKDVKNLSPIEQNKIIENFNLEFAHNLNYGNEDYLPNQQPLNSNISLFLEIRNLIVENTEKYLTLDLNLYFKELSNDDMLFFNRIKKDLTSYKKTSVIDEINLVNTAIEFLDLKNEEDKYSYIKQLDDDFTVFFTTNKQLTHQDKIKLAARRIALFKDFQSGNHKYYKKLIASFLNE